MSKYVSDTVRVDGKLRIALILFELATCVSEKKTTVDRVTLGSFLVMQKRSEALQSWRRNRNFDWLFIFYAIITVQKNAIDNILLQKILNFNV